MSLIRKLALPVAALTLAALLFGAYVSSASAQVPPFSTYGSKVKAGDKVEAFVGGKSCGTATADASGNWLLQIASTAPCSPTDGAAISFTLNGAATTASETYKAGGAPKDVANGVTLTLAAAPAPAATPKATPTAPAPAKTGNAGMLGQGSTGIAMVLALGALALIAVGGARAATRRR